MSLQHLTNRKSLNSGQQREGETYVSVLNSHESKQNKQWAHVSLRDHQTPPGPLNCPQWPPVAPVITGVDEHRPLDSDPTGWACNWSRISSVRSFSCSFNISTSQKLSEPSATPQPWTWTTKLQWLYENTVSILISQHALLKPGSGLFRSFCRFMKSGFCNGWKKMKKQMLVFMLDMNGFLWLSAAQFESSM